MPASSLPTPDTVVRTLRGVIDPELHENVVDLGMVKNATVDPDGTVTVHLALTIAGCPMRTQLKQETESKLRGLPGVTAVRVEMGEMTQAERSALMARARQKAAEAAPETEIPATARVLAVASGKGGVGKSSVTANLAVAMAARGLTVGVLDADIGGFSIPRMLGFSERVEATDRKMVPLERAVGAGRLKVLSMGLIEGASEDEAVMLRGLMLNRALQHFLEDAHWGDLDYLLIDMPPGTSDIQMGLARMLPRTEMLIVTTPALAAQKVATRAADMARRGYLKVTGVIENMSGFTCEHGTTHPLFGEGGGQRLADQVGAPLIGQVPIEPGIAEGNDLGRPVALGSSAAAGTFRTIAERLITDLLPPLEMEGCTARLLQHMDESLGPTGT